MDPCFRLAKWGARLFLVGLLTGFWVAAVMTGLVEVRIPRLAIAAHLNALLGGLWCIAVAATMSKLRGGQRYRERLCVLTLSANWANWGLTLFASILGYRGLELAPPWENQALAIALPLFVVLPALAAASLWVWGLSAPAVQESR